MNEEQNLNKNLEFLQTAVRLCATENSVCVSSWARRLIEARQRPRPQDGISEVCVRCSVVWIPERTVRQTLELRSVASGKLKRVLKKTDHNIVVSVASSQYLALMVFREF
eukprot:Gregarina_sp_Poly_1__3667@NODE_2080_length_2720_cov_125_513381_g1342_i0_p5_GENE_NODE_2080_length_2720_cov_125_513381_g1342_i0NODE_2080_length_2720_cov_125_513381_g1342_i0_p5_ORF_typecomplete_len110_score8_61Rpr2/PF04032_16/0_0069IN_DBD_C/PF00552_21/2_8e03IN_DBD_C/PF00552_21/0_19_NODE_2080_length_2720_cov_125_513381_g1342_i023272656